MILISEERYKSIVFKIVHKKNNWAIVYIQIKEIPKLAKYHRQHS